MHISYLSLGSNKGNRCEMISLALKRMQLHDICLLESSDLYETEPWGFVSGSLFVNQVVKVGTNLNPEELLKLINQTEKDLGRNLGRANRYHDRTIDIDILFYDQMILSTPDLTIPHPGIPGRRFILEPLATIAGDYVHPLLNETISELHAICTDSCTVRKFHSPERELPFGKEIL